MFNPISVLVRVLTSGFKTSEFVVTILALILPLIESAVLGALGPTTLVGSLVAAVFVWTRGYIKGKTGEAAATAKPVDPRAYQPAPGGGIYTESGNIVRPGAVEAGPVTDSIPPGTR